MWSTLSYILRTCLKNKTKWSKTGKSNGISCLRINHHHEKTKQKSHPLAPKPCVSPLMKKKAEKALFTQVTEDVRDWTEAKIFHEGALAECKPQGTGAGEEAQWLRGLSCSRGGPGLFPAPTWKSTANFLQFLLISKGIGMCINTQQKSKQTKSPKAHAIHWSNLMSPRIPRADFGIKN